MCGPNAKTNFPINPNCPMPPQSLSPNLMAKLERCCVASRRDAMNPNVGAGKGEEEKYCMEEDDECIEEMIEELIYYGSVEITSSSSNSSSSCSSSASSSMAWYGN